MISRRIVAILIYVLMVLLLFIFQPAMMFDDYGMIKWFDYDAENPNASLLALTIILPFMAIAIYFVIIIIELIFA